MPTAGPKAPVGFALQGGRAHSSLGTWRGPGQRSSYDIDALLKSV
jgi:hypothetical protein